MEKPKVKPTAPPPKTLERTVRTVKGVKSSVEKTSKGVQKARTATRKLNEYIPGEDKSHRPEEYMTDKVTEKTEYAVRKASGKVGREANDLVRKGVRKATEKAKANKQTKTKQAYEKAQSNTAKKPTVKEYQRKTTASKAKNATAQKRSAKSAIHTGEKAKRGIKSTRRTAKAAKKTVKTTKRGVKTAAKTAKRTAKAAKKAAVVAKKAAVMTAKAIKATVKAVIAAVKAAVAAVKAAVAAIKGLIALIAAGGWVVIVIILIIAVIMLIISSPFGAFTNESDGETPTLSEVVQEINGEYSATINNIVIDAGEFDEIIIEGETAAAGYTPTNWIDVLAVFSVNATMNDDPNEYMDVAIMDTEKVDVLKDVFWQMNSISYEIQEEIIPTPEPTPSPTPNPSASPSTSSPTPEPTPEIYRTLVITMECKTYVDGAAIYNFTDEQIEVLEEMMSPQYIAMYMELCGMDTFNGLTPEQLSQLINNLPEGELGSVIVEYALSRLGHPYSRPMRGQGNYVDCSYLARWCYQQAGVAHFTAGTAAEQARYCVNNSLCIVKSDLQIGDLIFWSFNTNGRFMNITHVGIYTGDDMVIDASSSRGMVVYRPIFGESSIVACGRPHVLN